jgi:hypothetical protein
MKDPITRLVNHAAPTVDEGWAWLRTMHERGWILTSPGDENTIPGFVNQHGQYMLPCLVAGAVRWIVCRNGRPLMNDEKVTYPSPVAAVVALDLFVETDEIPPVPPKAKVPKAKVPIRSYTERIEAKADDTEFTEPRGW